jgi:hypothetical protein
MSLIFARRLVCSLLSASLLVAGAAVGPVAAAGNPAGGAVQVRRIPFSDWLAAQTTTVVAWVGRVNSKPNSDFSNLAVVDYAGKLAGANGLDFGFKADGNVSVRKFEDGTGVALVNFNFENAITYASIDITHELIFGYRVAQVAGLGVAPALSSGHFQIEYAVADADNAELNLAQVLFGGDPGNVLRQIKFTSTGRGVCHAALGVPEGTPGQCVLANVGLPLQTGGALADGFPAEHVEVMPAGRASLSTGTTSVSTSPSVDEATAEPARTATTWTRLKQLFR